MFKIRYQGRPLFITILGKRPYILSLANETLIEIGRYLDPCPQDLRNYMSTCHGLSGAGEYVRYNTVVVSGREGCLLLAMLVSGTHTARRYCERIQRLWFRGWHDTDMFLNSELLSETLPLLTNLRTLWIEASPRDHPAFAAFGPHDWTSQSSPLVLPNLKYLRLSGEFSMHKIASHRALTELDLNSIMDGDEFAAFLDSVQDTLLGRHVETLAIRLCQELDLDFAVPLLAQAFPVLSRLSFEQSSLDFIKFARALACDALALPRIQYILLNERLGRPISAAAGLLAQKIPDVEEIEPLLRRIHETRFRFESVGVGKVIWSIGLDGRYRKTTVNRRRSFWRDKFGQQFSSKLYPSPQRTFFIFQEE
ncbi:hypothetical protein FA13DRAFT_1745189 [Coprinellus micaceus]|uniref:Uncharacterized protein n=1 Tax=Coprinellus micaceus TaxID=71717 RepID=A0A4Y7SB96_COPMI|nr:hypothetical protein FA13DRAFT_1745189 [Coprinellus micaceus]